MKPTAGQKYDHYKGGKYEIICIAEHTETKEKMVIYKSLIHGTTHCRPLSEWNRPVTNPLNPEYMPLTRFTLIT